MSGYSSLRSSAAASLIGNTVEEPSTDTEPLTSPAAVAVGRPRRRRRR